MRQGSLIEERAQPRRGAERGEQPILDVDVRSEEDLPQVHRRCRQVSSLLGFDTSAQTQIGTAVSDVVGAALACAGTARLEFSLRTGFPDAIYVTVHRGWPVKPNAEQLAEDQRTIRLASHLMDDAQLKVFGEETTYVLRRSLPASPPLTQERLREIRDQLARYAPRTHVEELREQNRELRRVQRELVLSELMLRQRIQQNALVADVSAELLGKEPLPEKLKRCAQEIVGALSVECALIWTMEAGATTLAASAGLAEVDLPPPQVGDCLLSALHRTTTRYASQSISEEPPSAHRDWASGQRLEAFASYPLKGEDASFGTLSVYARAAIAPDALQTLALVASQIAIGMERLQRLEERERLLASEHEARLRAERATKMRDQLMAIVAHDLRNPLSAIVTATALLKRAPLGADELRWRKHLATITSSVERMNRLILDLLDVASIESGRLSLESKPQSVPSMMRELFEHCAPLADARGLRLEAAEDESLAEIAGDRDRLLQAMFNLVDNAFKFSPPGGTVCVRAQRRGGEVVIGVADCGQGIAEADRAHIFEPYWQANPRARSGLGLGLSIAKGIVEAHHGRIWFEPREEGGTTFFLGLPVLAKSPETRAQLVH